MLCQVYRMQDQLDNKLLVASDDRTCILSFGVSVDCFTQLMQYDVEWNLIHELVVLNLQGCLFTCSQVILLKSFRLFWVVLLTLEFSDIDDITAQFVK